MRMLRKVQDVSTLPATHRTRHPHDGASELLKALSAPLRISIVLQLQDRGPLCVHELVEALEVAQPLVSQHLRILRAAAIVRGDRRGREVVYALTDEHVGHIVADAVAHAEEDR
ncbi:metalloregulator ArsR/SmtB family transcription factor [soil metagenome]